MITTASKVYQVILDHFINFDIIQGGIQVNFGYASLVFIGCVAYSKIKKKFNKKGS